ncbi:hypothetical protein Tco_0104322 [Tanacetum coccineum]
MDTEVINDSGKKNDSSSKPAGGKEHESAKSDEEAAADYEHEKEELRMWLTVVSDEEETVDPKILSAKYPIVDWESQNLGSVDMEDLHNGDERFEVEKKGIPSHQRNAAKDVETGSRCCESREHNAFELLKLSSHTRRMKK